MLRLERLDISGFKSFNEKASLSFPGAITAVVGPNGCGKSNICDAVAWVLGEQSAKFLRGETMDDVIFNGSGKRRPLGMAEVTLTLQSNNGDFQENDGRMSIGRRVYRDGEGEYLLNGVKVRLRDVQEVLFGTGLGVRAYSVIEQGKIDQVLSARPQERRKLIEEAAGITKYKLKKRAAELKLEETRANLTRLADIIAEVDRACASLKRQAARAERYKERSARLREKRAVLMRLAFDTLSAQTAEAGKSLFARRDDEARASADLAGCEAAEAEARRVSMDARNQRDAAREALSALTSAVERDDASIETARRAEWEIGARRQALSRDAAELQADSARRTGEKTRLDQLLSQVRAACESEIAARDAAAALRKEAEEALGRKELHLDAARMEVAAVAGERAGARNELHEIDLAAERVTSVRNRLTESRNRVEAALAALSAEIAGAQVEQSCLDALSQEHARACGDNERERAAAGARVEELERRRGEIREEMAALETRASSLDEIRRSREKDTDLVRTRLAAAGIAAGGLVASILRPRPGWEEIVDRLASEELGAIQVSGEAGTAAQLLRHSDVAGAVVGAKWNGDPPENPWEMVLENAREIPAALLASLPRVTFVDTAQEAQERARRRPHELFAARTGEIIRGALWKIPGPESGKEGPLTLKRDIDMARTKLSTFVSELAECEASLSEARRVRSSLDLQSASLTEDLRRAEAAAAAHSARLSERRDEERRRIQEKDTLLVEDAMLAEEAHGLAARRQGAIEVDAQHEARESSVRARIEALASEIAAHRPELSAFVEREAAARAAFEGARERLASAEREWAMLSAQEEAAARRQSESVREEQELAGREQGAKSEAEEARVRRDGNLTLRETAAREFESVSIASEGFALAAAEAEDAVKRVRAIFEAARQLRFDGEILHSRLSSDLGHAVQDVEREFGQTPEELPPGPALSEEERAAWEAEARDLAGQIENMGPVNVLAFEEYSEQSQRLEFLSTQRQDLESSIASLMDTIRKINATSSERFAEAFAAINTHFSALFQRLFGGGTAQMRLLDENDVLDSGIEITAQPPGKRTQSILLLSGGEKAMTAIALLMAIFRYKPSPFCILDEVDAPLDEANIDRFTRLIGEMTEETQFIAITHNKRTMETADALYGVTMEEPGCSKIVSVRLD